MRSDVDALVLHVDIRRKERGHGSRSSVDQPGSADHIAFAVTDALHMEVVVLAALVQTGDYLGQGGLTYVIKLLDGDRLGNVHRASQHFFQQNATTVDKDVACGEPFDLGSLLLK